MIEGLKPLYNRILLPLTKCSLHPNTVTSLGLFMFAVASTITAIGYWKTGIIIGTIGAIMDGLDGVIARATGKESAFGAFYDSVTDRLTEIFWFLGLLFYYTYFTDLRYGYVPIIGIFTLLSGALMVSYLRARAEGIGANTPGGVFQRPERLIILAILQLLGPNIMKWGVLILGILSYITVLERFIIIYKDFKNQ